MNKVLGNGAKSVFTRIGASNHGVEQREKDDYYATEPRAVELLLELEKFTPYVWECACGGGHISEVLKAHGYKVKSSDLYDRGYEGTEIIDFFEVVKGDLWLDCPRDIITNPPYKYAREFVEHALELIPIGNKVAMFLKIQFLEGKARRKLFDTTPPEKFTYRQAVCIVL
jgi:hypothetical protein